MKISAVFVSACIAAAMFCGCSAGKSEDKGIATLPPESVQTTESPTKEENGIVITTPEIDLSNLSFDPMLSMVMVAHMTAGDFSITYEKFSENMKSQMTEEQLAEAWELTVLPLGEPVGGGVYGIEEKYGYIIVTLSDVEFEYGNLDVQITYSTEGNIEGIYFYYA